MPFYAVYTALKYTWPFGDPFCKAYMTMDFTLCMESILMMIILSWDRVLLLRNGPGYTVKVTKVKAMWVIGGSWVIAFLLYGPAILMYDVITGENNVEEEDCDVQFANDFVFTFITALLEFVIPFVCLCLLNFYIYFQIRKRSKVRDAQTSKTMATISKSVSRDNGDSSQETSAGNTKTADSTNRRDRKAAKNLALLLVVFLVTWAPYTITTILISACESCVNEDLYEFLNWLLWAKAALNPFLYAYNNPRFRENFLDLLVCFKCFRVRKGAPATAASTMVSNA